MMKNIKNIFKGLFLSSFLVLGMNVFAQKVRPNSHEINLSTRVTDPLKAYDSGVDAESTFSKLTSLGVASGELTLKYNSGVQTGKKVYVKFNNSDSGSFLDYLLGGYVGNVLSDVLGFIIGGNHYTSIEAFIPKPSGSILTDNAFLNISANRFLNVSLDNSYGGINSAVSLAQSGDGNFYARFNVPSDKTLGFIRISDNNPTIIPTEIPFTDVYDVFYYNDPPSICDIPLLTSYTSVQSLLSLVNTPPVQNAYQAIDTDLNSFSTLGSANLLKLTLGGSIEQFFDVPALVNNKTVRIITEVPVGVLNLSLGGSMQLLFYNDNTLVETYNINQDVVNLDLLGLVNNTDQAKIAINYQPSVAFDKVSFKLNVPVEVGLIESNNVKIYDFALYNNDPIIEKVCTKEFVTSTNGVDIREIKFNITDIIPYYNSNPVDSYIVTNSSGQAIDLTNSNNVWQPLGSYIIKGITGSSEYCPSDNVSIKAIQDTQFRIAGDVSISMPLDANDDNTVDATHLFNSSDYHVIDFSNANANVSSDYQSVQIYRESDNVNVTGEILTFSQIGTYNFYAKTSKISDPDCEIVKRVTVYVYDKAECSFTYQQLGANYEKVEKVTLLGIPLSGQSNSQATIDSALQDVPGLYRYDLSSHGSIYNVVSLLGIGTTSQDLIFKTGENVNASSPNKQIDPGTPITIKIGQDYNALQVLGGITIRPLNTFGEPVGPLLSVDEFDLANVLAGDNVFEFTFVPKDDTGENIWYSGVRINLGSVLGVGNTVKIYGAYIDERIPVEDTICNPNIVVKGAETRERNAAGELIIDLDSRLLLNRSTSDVLYGTSDSGLAVATGLSSMLYPYYSADAIDAPGTPLHGTPNFDTGATFNASTSVLNIMTLTVKFKEIARPGDKVRMVLGDDGVSILDLNLLGQSVTAQRYMGSVAIGDPVAIEASSLISLDLLSIVNPQNTGKYVYTLDGIGAPFDRVVIQIGNVVNAELLAPKLAIYDVSLLPYFEFDSSDEITRLCTSAPFEIEKMDPCTTYQISFAYPTLNQNDEIINWNDIVDSEIEIANDNDDRVQYRLQMKNILNQYNNNGTLYMKVITKRQGCLYGDAQYLKVKLAACSTISNPMIRTRLKSN